MEYPGKDSLILHKLLSLMQRDFAPRTLVSSAVLQITQIQIHFPLPLAYKNNITQRFSSGHRGVDFGVPTNTPIYAATDGQVVTAGWSNLGYAWHIIISDNSQSVHTLYAHMPNGKHFAEGIRVGAQVKAGDHIGYADNTGNSTGPHLHFELRNAPYGYSNAVDPLPFMIYDHPTQETYPYNGLVVKERLSIYEKPKIKSQVVGHYIKGQIVTILADAPNSSGGDWVKVSSGYIMITRNGKTFVSPI